MKKLFFLALLISLFGQTTNGYIIHNKTVAEIPLEDYYLQARVGNPLSTVREKNRAL